MFSLPTLNQITADRIVDELGNYSFWGLLLFPKSDQNIAQALTMNWNLFSTSLGEKAHIITLMEESGEATAKTLEFPDNYDQSVGSFCNTLGVRNDQLPAIVALSNGQGNSIHYWSLAHPTLKGSSDALVSLTDDIREATQKTPMDCSAAEWQSRVINRVSRSRVMSDTRRAGIALSPTDLHPHLVKLLNSVRELIR